MEKQPLSTPKDEVEALSQVAAVMREILLEIERLNKKMDRLIEATAGIAAAKR